MCVWGGGGGIEEKCEQRRRVSLSVCACVHTNTVTQHKELCTGSLGQHSNKGSRLHSLSSMVYKKRKNIHVPRGGEQLMLCSRLPATQRKHKWAHASNTKESLNISLRHFLSLFLSLALCGICLSTGLCKYFPFFFWMSCFMCVFVFFSCYLGSAQHFKVEVNPLFTPKSLLLYQKQFDILPETDPSDNRFFFKSAPASSHFCIPIGPYTTSFLFFFLTVLLEKDELLQTNECSILRHQKYMQRLGTRSCHGLYASIYRFLAFISIFGIMFIFFFNAIILKPQDGFGEFNIFFP